MLLQGISKYVSIVIKRWNCFSLWESIVPLREDNDFNVLSENESQSSESVRLKYG